MEAENNLLSADVQNSITLRVPSFNTNRPRVWFHQLEAIFSNRRITSERILFIHVVEALPSEIAEEVEDIHEHLPTEKQFDALKEAILSRLQRSDNAKLRELLNNVPMEDRTPSHLLRFMKSLLGRRHTDESIMRQVWFEKLPQAMTPILRAFSEEKTPSQLAELANRIANTYHQKPLVSQVSSENHREDEAVSHLCKRCSMKKKGPSRSNFHRSAQCENSSKNRPPPGKYFCCYHFMFCEKAAKCQRQPSVIPCFFSQKDLKSPHLQITATTPAGNIKLDRLLYIQDLKSNRRILVDTGAEISVIPPTSIQRTSASNKTLLAANGTTIQTFGTTALNINFGMGRNFLWTFEIADVKSPIIGADFLLHFSLSVDLKNRRFIDNTNICCGKHQKHPHNRNSFCLANV